MKIIVNGQEKEVSINTLESLIEHYNLNKAHVVAEVDGIIIERENWQDYRLLPGSKVELVHFVGGG